MADYLIRTIDIETTGKPEEEGAEVVELGCTDLILSIDGESRSYRVGGTRTCLFGVSKPMSPEVLAVHHIRNEEVAHLAVATGEVLAGLLTEGEPHYVAAHKADFEQHFLRGCVGRAKWLCTFKAAKHLFPDGPFTNQGLRYLLGLELPEERAMPPHRAGPDSYVTAHILGEMLMRTTGQQIEAWTRSPEHHPTCPIGKHKGPWENIPADYLHWMLRQTEMEASLKAGASAELQRRRDAQTAAIAATAAAMQTTEGES